MQRWVNRAWSDARPPRLACLYLKELSDQLMDLPAALPADAYFLAILHRKAG